MDIEGAISTPPPSVPTKTSFGVVSPPSLAPFVQGARLRRLKATSLVSGSPVARAGRQEISCRLSIASTKMPIRVNQRSVEARERRAAAAAAKVAAAEQEAERKKWEDNDKLIARKLDRKAESQAKAEERLQRKLELRKLADEEMQRLARSSTKKNQPAAKLTRAEILQRQLRAAALEKESTSPSEDGSVAPLEPNINHIMRAETIQAQIEGRCDVLASGLDDALSQLNITDGGGEDRHPERRMKAAFRAYEEHMMPKLKAENPTLKRSQLLELLSKQWKKAPENPFNQIC